MAYSRNVDQWKAMGTKIAQLRKLSGRSIDDMMKVLDIKSRRGYLSYEEGVSHFTPKMISILAKEFDVTEAFLVNDTVKVEIHDRYGKVEMIEIHNNTYLKEIVSGLKFFNKFNEEAKAAICSIIDNEILLLERETRIREMENELQSTQAKVDATDVQTLDSSIANDLPSRGQKVSLVS